MIVQKIPPNSKKSKMGVNENGKIIIPRHKGKPEIVAGIEEALRQQGIHIPSSYMDTIIDFGNSLSIERAGEVNKLYALVMDIENIKKSLETIDTKEIQDTKQKLITDFKEVQKIIPERIKRDIDIILAVQTRTAILLEEKNRCEKIVNLAVKRFGEAYKYFVEFDNNKKAKISWSDIIQSLKSLKTVKVNPFRERTWDRRIKILRGEGKEKKNIYDIYKEGDIKLCKKRIWEAIAALIPVYTSKCEIHLKVKNIETTIILEKGSVKVIFPGQGRG